MEENQVQAQEAQKMTENAGAQAEQEKPSENEKRFTQSDVEKLLDSRLKRERETWEKRLTESQKLSKMTEDQKRSTRTGNMQRNWKSVKQISRAENFA